jgi:hypothetical protein
VQAPRDEHVHGRVQPAHDAHGVLDRRQDVHGRGREARHERAPRGREVLLRRERGEVRVVDRVRRQVCTVLSGGGAARARRLAPPLYWPSAYVTFAQKTTASKSAAAGSACPCACERASAWSRRSSRKEPPVRPLVQLKIRTRFLLRLRASASEHEGGRDDGAGQTAQKVRWTGPRPG